MTQITNPAILQHRQFALDDYEYLVARDFTDEEILARWDRNAQIEDEWANAPDLVFPIRN